jgi:hypothetical protein
MGSLQVDLQLELPPCFICEGSARLVRIISPLRERPKVYISECTKCGHYDMYALIQGSLQKL